MENDESTQLATLRRMVALQAQICYLNVDRTLATWTRTSLALIVFGVVVDRYGLLLTRDNLAHIGTRLAPNPVSGFAGIVLVALGIFVVTAILIRHLLYSVVWSHVYRQSSEIRGPFLSITFAAMTMIFGATMLTVLLVFVQ